MEKFNKWAIFRANLDPVIGSEQGKSRPVLIISENEINELLNTINVIPLTSKKEGRTIYPNESFLSKNSEALSIESDSVILCHQIRTIDKRRLSKMYGKIESVVLQKEIEEALSFQLGL
jgi:mRNA interferase MazF